MLRFHFSRDKRAFGLILQESTWAGFVLSLFGLWWIVSLPWQLAVMLHYEPKAWPVAVYNVALFGVIGWSARRRERLERAKRHAVQTSKPR